MLIQGESGTGKELVARAVHFHGPRAREPFVPVDCGAIHPNLMASELFGHVKGAFTGADAPTPGLLRAAGRGTVFLDEVSEIPLGVQATLLRTLQEMDVRPVGGHRAEPFDARVVAATNCDLASAVAEGRFRRDLYYRLNVLRVDVPPLRERRDDIPHLAAYFVERLRSVRDGLPRITPAAMQALCEYPWPGNVRELENVIKRAVTFARNGQIDLDDLPPEVTQEGPLPGLVVIGPPAACSRSHTGPGRRSAPPLADGVIETLPGGTGPAGRSSAPVRSLAEAQRQAIAAALDHTGGNKRQAARVLKIGVATLYRKMARYGLRGETAT